ncbi:hypothetical protein [Bradyrhizobium sp. 21]|uniref:hypothetical protein n=1 Tax=Bradyrhizobium sp. 21 TaxID=2782666 RepID=UPI001FFC0180|nr:hypothetical protein [Bradyrhizobium sp. 21]MCK1389022.1 hypothetical protein [Bradyrhizobium sp. 21]
MDVIIASAIAKDDVREFERIQAGFEFKLLAAADSEQPRLPSRDWSDRRQMLSAEIEEVDAELRVTFQSMGYAALRQFAGRAARMLSNDGAIDVAFRFDSQGRSVAIVANSPLTRQAMINFRVLLE